MATKYFTRTTRFIACLITILAVTPSANAQVYMDAEVQKIAEREGLAKELEARRQMWSQVQVSPSNIECRQLDDGKVLLAPYCTLELGDKASQTEWMVNKTPPMFVSTIKDTGAIIFSILPAQGSDVTNKLLYDATVEKFRGKMKTLEATEFHQLSKTEGEGTLSGQHTNGNRFNLYLRLITQNDFVLMVQGFGSTPSQTKAIVKIINTIEFAPATNEDSIAASKSQGTIAYGKSRLIVPSPQGLVCGTEAFPLMVAEMNKQSPTKVSEVFVSPTATQAIWATKGLYRNGDARTAGPMTTLEFRMVCKEFRKAVKQELSLSPQLKLTGMIEMNDPNTFCYTHRAVLPNKTRIGMSALWLHDGQLFQFCLHTDERTAADEAWAKSAMKNWLRSIRDANSKNKIASK